MSQLTTQENNVSVQGIIKSIRQILCNGGSKPSRKGTMVKHPTKMMIYVNCKGRSKLDNTAKIYTAENWPSLNKSVAG